MASTRKYFCVGTARGVGRFGRVTGDLDFYTATGTTTRAALRNVPVRVIMVGLNRPQSHVLVASKEFTSVERLQGESSLGKYTAQATVNTILIELLQNEALKPDEYKILNVGTAQLPRCSAATFPPQC